MNIPYGSIEKNVFNMVIEMSEGHHTVKYEYNSRYAMMMVDRFMRSPLFYPCAYGFIPQTLAKDGDTLDAICISSHNIAMGSCISVRAVGVFFMEDESGEDSKILCIPKSDDYYDDVHNINQVSSYTKERINYFFSHYKDQDINKWSRCKGWGDLNTAISIINSSIIKNS